MHNLVLVTSRHAPFGAMASPRTTAAIPRRSTLAALCKTYGADPIQLLRSREARSLSRERYRRAGEFMLSPTSGDWPNFLYLSGITAQLALSSHLLDVGFADAWCARNIGLRVASSLAFANATGLGYDCTEIARLADVLTPYCKWNARSLPDNPTPDDGGFNCDEVRTLLRDLLDHVGQVTGHGHRRRRAPSSR